MNLIIRNLGLIFIRTHARPTFCSYRDCKRCNSFPLQLITLDIKGNTNVLVCVEEKHFKSMGTLLAALAVRKQGGKFVSVPINPAIIIFAPCGS